MEALIFIAIGVAITYFVMKSRKTIEETRTPNEEINDLANLVHYKRRILKTSAYTESSTYELLYFRVGELTNTLLLKHEKQLLPTEGINQIESDFEKYYEKEEKGWRIRKTLRIETLSDPEILVLAVYSFTGLYASNAKKVAKNRFFANRAIEYLISERGSTDAFLAKGLILLFGFQEYLAPQTKAAEVAINTSRSMHMVQEELAAIGALRELEDVKSVHSTHVSQTWRSHSDLSALISVYHPDNING